MLPLYEGMRASVLLCSIQALLSAPNPDDPLAENVAKHWKENEAEAMATGEPPHNLRCRRRTPSVFG